MHYTYTRIHLSIQVSMSMISDLSNCLYEVNLIDCSCKSNESDGIYYIYINIGYKNFPSDDLYYNLSFRINTFACTGINIFPGSNDDIGCTKCLEKMAVFYTMIIYPDAFESVDMSSVDG